MAFSGCSAWRPAHLQVTTFTVVTTPLQLELPTVWSPWGKRGGTMPPATLCLRGLGKVWSPLTETAHSSVITDLLPPVLPFLTPFSLPPFLPSFPFLLSSPSTFLVVCRLSLFLPPSPLSPNGISKHCQSLTVYSDSSLSRSSQRNAPV